MWPKMLKYLSDSLQKKCDDPALNKNKGLRESQIQFKTCQVWGKSKASQVKLRP